MSSLSELLVVMRAGYLIRCMNCGNVFPLEIAEFGKIVWKELKCPYCGEVIVIKKLDRRVMYG